MLISELLTESWEGSPIKNDLIEKVIKNERNLFKKISSFS